MKKLFLMLVCCSMVATANAQLGGLMKKAKKVKESVSNPVGNRDIDVSNPSSVVSSATGGAISYADQEKAAVAAAGGMQKYLGLTDEKGQVFWKYYKMGEDFETENEMRIAKNQKKKTWAGGEADASSAAYFIGKIMRLMKGNRDVIDKRQLYYEVNNSFEANIQMASKVNPNPIPKADSAVLMMYYKKVRDEYNKWREDQSNWNDE